MVSLIFSGFRVAAVLTVPISLGYPFAHAPLPGP